jgi:hypothetical protein
MTRQAITADSGGFRQRQRLYSWAHIRAARGRAAVLPRWGNLRPIRVKRHPSATRDGKEALNAARFLSCAVNPTGREHWRWCWRSKCRSLNEPSRQVVLGLLTVPCTQNFCQSWPSASLSPLAKCGTLPAEKCPSVPEWTVWDNGTVLWFVGSAKSFSGPACGLMCALLCAIRNLGLPQLRAGTPLTC